MAAHIAVARTTDLRGVTSQASATREPPVRAEPHPTRSFAIQAFGNLRAVYLSFEGGFYLAAHAALHSPWPSAMTGSEKWTHAPRP
jgi:hypothetical protein